MRKNNIVIFFIFTVYALTFLLSPPLTAGAETDGGDILFEDTKKLSPVLFSHKKHADAGNKCEDCHDRIFQKKKGSTDKDNALTMKTMKAGEYCGVCHDGSKAFSIKSSCKKCHVEPKQ